jgi:hypothetical protein
MDWMVISNLFPGWSLTEIKSLSPRERKNWMDIAISFKKTILGK